jgi:hypothetical protein
MADEEGEEVTTDHHAERPNGFRRSFSSMWELSPRRGGITMGWVHVVINVSAAVLLYSTKHNILFWVAVALSVFGFWSFGIMHNFYYRTGNPLSAPDWATRINMVASIAGVGVFIYSIAIRFF